MATNFVSYENMAEIMSQIESKKQSKTLSSPIIVEGVSQDTVEKVLTAINISKINDASIAQKFVTNKNFSVNDIVSFNGKLYKFTSAHPAGSWTGSDVIEINLESVKQDVLTFDSQPIENSENPVTSGGIYSALPKYSNVGENLIIST